MIKKAKPGIVLGTLCPFESWMLQDFLNNRHKIPKIFPPSQSTTKNTEDPKDVKKCETRFGTVTNITGVVECIHMFQSLWILLYRQLPVGSMADFRFQVESVVVSCSDYSCYTYLLQSTRLRALGSQRHKTFKTSRVSENWESSRASCHQLSNDGLGRNRILHSNMRKTRARAPGGFAVNFPHWLHHIYTMTLTFPFEMRKIILRWTKCIYAATKRLRANHVGSDGQTCGSHHGATGSACANCLIWIQSLTKSSCQIILYPLATKRSPEITILTKWKLRPGELSWNSSDCASDPENYRYLSNSVAVGNSAIFSFLAGTVASKTW